MNTRSRAGSATKQFSLLEKFSLSFIKKKKKTRSHSKNLLTRLRGVPVNEIIFSILATLVTYFWQSLRSIFEMNFYRIYRPHPEVITQSF